MDYTIIGRIINSHGVKGEVKIYPLTDDLKRFSNLGTAYIGEEKTKVKTEKVKYHKNMVILKFYDYDDINEILKFKDKFIYVSDSDRITLPDDHFFIYDLLNSSVYDIDSNLIGVLVDVLQGASNDVYVVRGDNNKEYMIPAVKEFIKEVNIIDKRITIDPIEGMII